MSIYKIGRDTHVADQAWKLICELVTNNICNNLYLKLYVMPLSITWLQFQIRDRDNRKEATYLVCQLPDWENYSVSTWS